MKTFKTITFVTATTAVVSAVTLFTVEQSKIEKDFFEDEEAKSGYMLEKESKNSPTNLSDTLEIFPKSTPSLLSKTNSRNSAPVIQNDTLIREGVISK